MSFLPCFLPDELLALYIEGADVPKSFNGSYKLQETLVNQHKNWTDETGQNAVWFSNGFWRIGQIEDIGSDNCRIKTQNSSENPDIKLKWLYWSNEAENWIKFKFDLRGMVTNRVAHSNVRDFATLGEIEDIFFV